MQMPAVMISSTGMRMRFARSMPFFTPSATIANTISRKAIAQMKLSPPPPMKLVKYVPPSASAAEPSIR